MITANVAGEVARRESLHGEAENIVARRSEAVKEFVGHVFNVPNSRDFEHVENVLHEKITASPRRESFGLRGGCDAERRTTLFSTGNSAERRTVRSIGRTGTEHRHRVAILPTALTATTAASWIGSAYAGLAQADCHSRSVLRTEPDGLLQGC